ncbi:hypothetical protein DL89DRAFT_33263 [Linderina pennispora]|uniref:Fe2OG dioxygenase domain-containing protein n=1 Tax=Linderina pennispora TaxID=61395 RepID=A0A1Y1W4X5_9FUNG|nr:uncharacterized protein DL89DRAFT_33263 [Linderina pennispora]ORX68405.1 hypothetical protein DL89DRAFT_33263 [Linderina pennispora]
MGRANKSALGSSKSNSSSSGTSKKSKRSAASDSRPGAAKPRSAAATIEWPAVKPKKGLQLAELVSGHIFLIRNLLSKQECDAFIRLADDLCVPTPGVPKRGEAFRNNARWSGIDTQFAQALWTDSGMGRLLGGWTHPDGREPVGLLENIRLYRYGPGQRFGKHYDDYFFDPKGRRTEYTLLIYLNAVDDERFGAEKGGRSSGGETVFYAGRMQPVSVKPEMGLALLHKHGADCLQHEALEIQNSYKYVLRSDLVFDRAGNE